MNPPCPGNETWLRLLGGALEEAQTEPLARHLESCPACRQQLEQLAGHHTTSFVVAAGQGTESGTPPALAQAMTRLKHGSARESPPQPVSVLALLKPARRPGAIGTFGGYDIFEVAGTGGMGTVLKAFDPSLERVVAIKVLAPVLAASAGSRARFLREARAAASVHHDNVVVIHAVGEEAGLPFLVMQFIAGGTLQQRLERRGPLTFPEIVQVGRQLAAGLAAAHALGLVHRDIKPGNILLEDDLARVRIADFGLVRSGSETAENEQPLLAGTPQYMSPEQAEGGRVDARSDLYSLGAVLYALATGEPPLESGSLGDLLRRLRQEPPPMLPARVGFPEGFRQFLHRLMSRSPAARPAAEEVEAALAGWLPNPLAGPGRRMLQVAPAILLALFALVLWQSGDRQPVSGPDGDIPLQCVILESGVEYTNLTEAVAAARPGDVIEIGGSRPFRVEPLVIERALHIRAAPGSQPELICEAREVPLLSATADLTLEGLILRHRLPTVEAPPLIRISNASLRLVHCRLTKRSLVTRPEAARVFCIEARDAPRVELLNSELVPQEQGVGGVLAEFSSEFGIVPATGGLVHFDHSFIGGMQCLRVENHAPQPVRIVFDRCLLLPRGLIRLDEQGSANVIDVTVTGCVIDAASLLFGMTWDPDHFRRNVRWSGQDNRYSLQFGYVASPHSFRARFRSPHPHTFAEWTRQPGVTETDSRPAHLALRTHLTGELAQTGEITAARLPFPTDLDQRHGPDPAQIGPGEPFWRRGRIRSRE